LLFTEEVKKKKVGIPHRKNTDQPQSALSRIGLAQRTLTSTEGSGRCFHFSQGPFARDILFKSFFLSFFFLTLFSFSIFCFFHFIGAEIAFTSAPPWLPDTRTEMPWLP
jgi:hypothetical protein